MKSSARVSNNKVLPQEPNSPANSELFILKAIAEQTGAMIAYFDLTFSFIFVNTAYAKGSGYSISDLLGKNHFSLFPNKENQAIFETVRDTGQPVQFLDKPFQFATQPDRGVTYWDWTLTPVRDSQGKIQGLILTLMETTDRKKAEEKLRVSEERFKVVAEAANVMVYEIDVTTGKVTIIRGSEELVGFKPSEVDFTVNWILSRTHPNDIAKILTEMKNATGIGTQDNFSIEYRFLHRDGKYITVKDTAKAVRNSDGRTIRLIGGIRDITKRKQDEERLEQYSKHLEQLVEKRTEQLKKSERLAAIGQTAAMVGHDIRNPLQAITSDIYLINECVKSLENNDLKSEIKESLDSVSNNVAYINKIVADLQDYTKVLNPSIQTINLKCIFEEVVAESTVPEGIAVSIIVKSQSETLESDAYLLKRIIGNLVINALQAMPNGGKLTLLGHRVGTCIEISVEDTGIGIPKGINHKVFTPMFTTKAKGQGFGLAVVKRLVEALGGSISFKSEERKGTKFIIKLPRTTISS